MRPVGSAGLMFSSVRAMTLPDTWMTLSSFTVSAALNASESGVKTHLRHAVVIAQIDEQQLAVIALAMHPAGQHDVLPHVLGPSSSFVCVRYLFAMCISPAHVCPVRSG